MDVVIQTPGSLRLQLPERDWHGRYDVFSVARSLCGAGGPYVPLTEAAWCPARLVVPPRNSYDVQGRSLDLLLGGRIEVAVTFTGTSVSEVMSVLALAMPGYLAVTPLAVGGFSINTVNVGLGASIEVVSGDAAPLLGLPDGRVQYGRDMWLPLVEGRTAYLFIDPYGRSEDYYQVRLLDSSKPGGCGLLYPNISGKLRNPLPIEQLITAQIELHDAAGRAVEGALVSLCLSQRCQPGNIYPTAVNFITDGFGRGQCLVVRGLRMTLSIAGTNLAREILVPEEGNAFDLLDPVVSVDNDAYKVQVPDLVVGERRTL